MSLAQTITLACVLEATAHKPGNVHRGADFADMTYLDMVKSAIAVGPVLAKAGELGVGKCIHDAVAATQMLVGKNTNLGTLLLLGPLAAASDSAGSDGLRQRLVDVIQNLDESDSAETYRAIRLAKPGGIGQVTELDVHSAEPISLLRAMELAANRDLVARQFTNTYEEIFGLVLPTMEQSVANGIDLLDAIVHAHVVTMATFPDSLIARKCGASTAQEASDRAANVLAAGPPTDDRYFRELAELDFWLRADGHRRNPGTTADLIAAALFVGLITEVLTA